MVNLDQSFSTRDDVVLQGTFDNIQRCFGLLPTPWDAPVDVAPASRGGEDRGAATHTTVHRRPPQQRTI